MKKILSTIVLASVITLCMTSQAFAAKRQGNALVSKVRVDANGFGIIALTDINWSPGKSTRIACVSSTYANAIAFDTNTWGGQSIMSVALAAKLSGKRVTFVTQDECRPYGQVEGASMLQIYQ
ncbi:MAG: hypothetical protein GY847_04865 [Proteobacteria bacterium]|nr:hypothetical protein [Pseudomonadota bacterium]